MLPSIIILQRFVLGLLAARITFATPECYEVVIPVTIEASNIRIPRQALSAINPGNILSGAVTTLFSIAVPFTGTYNIAGRYCEPEVTIVKRRDTLQILVHPATYDRNYVSASHIALNSLTVPVVGRRISRVRMG